MSEEELRFKIVEIYLSSIRPTQDTISRMLGIPLQKVAAVLDGKR